MIHFFCALPCEAKPLLSHFKLQQQSGETLFPLYLTKEKDISLTVTGAGKLNAAAAVSYHHALIGTNPGDSWINIGVAGHRSAKLGNVYLANKIYDTETGACWYPQFACKLPCETLTVNTLSTASDLYTNELFDMESAGFYQMSGRLGTAELIHCMKVISDNAEQTMHSVSAKQVSELIENGIDLLEQFLSLLKPLSSELHDVYSPPAYFNTILTNRHFTKTEQHQLERLLRQWYIRKSNIDPRSIIDSKHNAKDILSILDQELMGTPFFLGNIDTGRS